MKDLKKLIPYVKPHTWKMVLVFTLGLMMSLADTGVAMIVKPLFEEVFEKKNSDLKLIMCFSIIGIYIVHGVARYFHLYVLKTTIERITAKIRQDLQNKYMDLRLSYHSDTNPGALLSKIMNDVAAISEGLRRMADVAKEPITALLLIGWVFYLDWKLTLFIFIAAPVIFIVLRIFSKSARKYTHQQMESLENVTYTFKETLDGLRIIQSFNLQNEMRRRLDQALQLFIKLRKKVISREEASGPITEFLAALIFSAVLYYKAGQVIEGTGSIGAFMSYLASLAFLQMPIKKLQEAIVRLQATSVSTIRVFQILENNQVVPQPKDPHPFPVNWDKIQFKNVSFQYESKQPILKNINLTIQRGEIIALVGESGCGKSTLVNLLERFYDPTSGEVLIGDINIQDIPVTELRRHIGLVTQDVFLFNDSIERNIQSGNFFNETMSTAEAAKLANASDFIERTSQQYRTSAGDRGARLSGGEKQRISIARAIYKNAPIMILDEATSALDSVSELEVQKGLDRLMEGRTVIVIAHRLSTIANANRICVLREGQIVEEGTHLDLMNQGGLYYQFHK